MLVLDVDRSPADRRVIKGVSGRGYRKVVKLRRRVDG
jgi:hypothetical protein